MIVAINKIDNPKPPGTGSTELLQYEVQVERSARGRGRRGLGQEQDQSRQVLEMIALPGRTARPQDQWRAPRRGLPLIEAKLGSRRVRRDRAGATRHGCASATSSWPAPKWVASAHSSTIGRYHRRARSLGSGRVSALRAAGSRRSPRVWRRARAAVTSYRAPQKRENAAAAIAGMRVRRSMMFAAPTTGVRISADHQARRAGLAEAISRIARKARHRRIHARILHAGAAASANPT